MALYWLDTATQDVRYALRILKNSPGFTAVAILSLALGLGANIAIFSLLDAVILKYLPVERPGELRQLQYRVPESSSAWTVFTNPAWEQMRDHQNVFTEVFAWGNQDNLDLTEGEAMRPANGVWVSGGFFRALGLHAAAGRLISDTDDRRGCPAVAVLSYGFWQDHFGGAKSAIGSTLSVRERAFEVIGVAPRGFFGMEVGHQFDLALPVCATAIFDGEKPRLENGNMWWLNVGGRINPTMSGAQRAAGLRVLSNRIFIPLDASPEERQYLSKMALTAIPIASGISRLRQQFGQRLQILMVVVGLVLLIACANLGSLMLARAAACDKEFAVRRALGAGHTRLIRQLVTECLLLSAGGVLLGALLARWTAALLVRMISTARSAVFLDLAFDTRMLVFVVAVAGLTPFLFGLLPALHSTRVSLSTVMKGSQSSEGGRSHFQVRRLIVGSQVALSLPLLVAAGLLLRSFVKLVTLDVGFDRNNVLLVQSDLGVAKIPVDRQVATWEEIESRLSTLPGVLSAGLSTITPVSGVIGFDNSIHTAWTKRSIVREDSARPLEDDWVYQNFISPGYLPTLRMPLLAGRNFTRADIGSPVAIVNQTFARRFFPGLNPIARSYLVGAPAAHPVEVVGLVEDSKYFSLREENRPVAFLPLGQERPELRHRQTLELRTAIPPSELILPVRGAIAGVSSAIPMEFHTLADQVNDSLVQERLSALLAGFFGALALILAMIGLYGTFSHSVTQRQTEFGVRMALGAQPTSILTLVIRELIAVLAGGLAAGILISLATTRLLQQMLYGLAPRDTTTMVLAVGVLSAVALLAGYIPARRAMRVDPMTALRQE